MGKRIGLWAVSLTGILLVALAGLAVPGRRKAAETVERPLLPNPPVVARSADEQHLVWAQLTPGGKSVMVIDGRAEPEEYDEIHHLITFSPDGRRVAYEARRGSKWSVVVDGRPGPEYISLSYVTFSPDGRRLAYGATRGDQWFVVLDGKEMPDRHSFVAYLTFSPDGRRFAYAADRGVKQFMVVDGHAGPEYDATGEPVFSPDGKHVAYVAMDGNEKRAVVLDGKEGKKYDWVEKPVFSRDGRHIAYSVRKSGKSLVVVDGQERPEYEMSSPINPVLFAPNDGRVAYAAKKGAKWVAVLDDREGPEFDRIIPESLIFSPDGKHFAYIAVEGGRWFVVVDGEKEGPGYNGLKGQPLFSPDGKRLVYGAWKNDTPYCSICGRGVFRRLWFGLMYVLKKTPQYFLVIDGREGRKYDDLDPKSIAFSPAGKHLVFTAVKLNKRFVVLDGQEAASKYDRVWKPAFTADGVEYLAERAERSGNAWLLRCRQSYNGKVVETKIAPSPRIVRETPSSPSGNIDNENSGSITESGSDSGEGKTSGRETTTLYLFWGEGCPHCQEEKDLLDVLKKKYSQLEIKMYEIWHNQKNAQLFSDMLKAFAINENVVPTTFIGGRAWGGFNESIGEQIEEQIQYCLKNGCNDPISRLKNEKDKIYIHIFLQKECPQCQESVAYLNALTEKYNINLVQHDVSQKEERELYEKFKKLYNFKLGAYPIVFLGDKFLIGATAIKENFERELIACLEKDCKYPTKKIDGLTPYLPNPKDVIPEENKIVTLPLLGHVDSAKISLPILALILGFLDSFNPCAFFVLFVLLSMLIYAKSRKRMLLIGGTFVFFSGLIYFLFMSAWLNLFLLLGRVNLITLIAGIIALVVAAINIKDFFFEKGISLVIPEKAKPKLFERMRNLLQATSLVSMMLGTIVLAVSANTYELLCTAGFPMVFTRALTLHGLSMQQYYLYLVFYNVIYVIPLLAIVIMFAITLGSRKLTKWEGQILKLISGMMMLCLGLVLLIKPALLNNFLVTISLMTISLLIAGVIVFITVKITAKQMHVAR